MKTDNEYKVEWVALDDLTQAEENPRVNDDTVPYLVNSIRRFGFRVPLVIDGDAVIVCGNTRYKAAMQLGMEQVPCVRVDGLSDEQVKAFRIADNKIQEMSSWDDDELKKQLDELSSSFDEAMADFGFVPHEDLGGMFGDEPEDGSGKVAKHECTCPGCGHKWEVTA